MEVLCAYDVTLDQEVEMASRITPKRACHIMGIPIKSAAGLIDQD